MFYGWGRAKAFTTGYEGRKNIVARIGCGYRMVNFFYSSSQCPCFSTAGGVAIVVWVLQHELHARA